MIVTWFVYELTTSEEDISAEYINIMYLYVKIYEVFE